MNDDADAPKTTKPDMLILVRHGEPALSRRVWLTWRGYRKWWADYDAGGLRLPQGIPRKLTIYAHIADVVMSSPLPRALETAHMASGREPDIIDPDLVEAALPPPHLGPVKLPPMLWGVLARVAWFFGWADGEEPVGEARARARRMCEKLDAQASGGKLVFVTGHGWYNRMLDFNLQRMGWKRISQNGDHYWSHRAFERR